MLTVRLLLPSGVLMLDMKRVFGKPLNLKLIGSLPRSLQGKPCCLTGTSGLIFLLECIASHSSRGIKLRLLPGLWTRLAKLSDSGSTLPLSPWPLSLISHCGDLRELLQHRRQLCSRPIVWLRLRQVQERLCSMLPGISRGLTSSIRRRLVRKQRISIPMQ